MADPQSAPLLRSGGETPRRAANDGSPVSRVSLGFAILAAVAFFTVVATSSNVVSLGGDGGRGQAGGGIADGRANRASLSALEKSVLDDTVASDFGGNNLSPACSEEVIAHQRVFVNGLEGVLSNGCGGTHFEPLTLRDEILEEEGHPKASKACKQKFMDHVFVKTFARVYQWLCESDESTLNMVMGFDATVPASAFTPYLLGNIELALASVEGLRTDQIHVMHVMSAKKAKGVDAYAKLLARGKKTAGGASPNVVVVVNVTGEDMETSLLAMTHFAHMAGQGLIATTLQQEAVTSIRGSVVLGWLPPSTPVPDHFNRFSDFVQAMLGSAVLV